MFDLERFLSACSAAAASTDNASAVREVVAEAVSDPAALAAALGEPEHAGVQALHRAPNLTVIHFTWAPWMSMKPHNHTMWSVVGIFSGREDNVFWRRSGNSIAAHGARTLGPGETALLGPEVIHSVVNPLGKRSRAIHVYGGDFFAPVRPRSEWDHESLAERPWNMDDTRRLFAEAELRSHACTRALEERS